jgi:hypothetical protein
MRLEIVEYTSDYTGEQRFALRIDGRYPPELDFSTAEEAKAMRGVALTFYAKGQAEPNGFVTGHERGTF